MKSSILITGSNGFIGGFLVEEALASGLVVYAAVRKNSDHQALKGMDVNILTMDYNDVGEMAALFRLHRFEYIIHNAGLTKSPDPDELIRINKGLLANIIEAIRLSELKLKKIVFISSLAAYGSADLRKDGIVRDTDTPQPVTHYGWSKLAAENYLKAQTDIPYIIIRPTVVYGPREKDLLNVFKMINNRLDIQPGLISQKLTFIYVKDLAKLIRLALISEQSKKAYFATDGHVYTGEAFSGFIKEYMHKWALTIRVPIFLVKGIAFMVEKLGGIWDNYPVLNMDKVNELKARNWNCDVSNLYTDLGFTAEYDLTKGIPETIDWYKKNNWL